MKIAILQAALIAGLLASIPATGMAQQEAAGKAGEAKPMLHAVVELDDGSRLEGVMPADITFPMQSSELNLNLAVKWVKSVTMARDHKSAEVIMQNGDRIAGALSMQPLPLKTVFGDTKLDPGYIKAIRVFGSGAAAEPGLVFWNTLASEEEALHSEVGPGLEPYSTGGAGGPSGEYDRKGAWDFPSGEHDGGAVTIKGTYNLFERIHILELDGLDKLIDPDQGCIEFWYYQTGRPVGRSHGFYRMFDGDSGLGSSVQFYAADKDIIFHLDCGGEMAGVNSAIESVPDNQWVHLAATWNRKGLEDTHETIRLYINGKEVTSSTAANWGSTVSGKADICGGQDADCAGKFFMSNLKIWNREKTKFDLSKKPDVVPKNIPPPTIPGAVLELED